MSIEASVRAMLTSASGGDIAALPDARITHGFRLQETALPAITFEIDRTEYLSIGATPLMQANVELRVIAETTLGALAFEDDIIGAVRTGTFSGTVFKAVDFSGRQVEAPSVAEGDEAEPAQLVCYFTVYY